MEELEPLRRKDLSDPKDVFALGVKLCNLFDNLRKTGIAYNDCKLRHRPDSFAEQNGRGAERADTLAL